MIPVATHAVHVGFFFDLFIPWEHICLRNRYSATATNTCLLRICCSATDVLLFVSMSLPSNGSTCHSILLFFYYLVCEATGTAATPDLLCQPRVIMKMIVVKQIECRLAGETEVLGENLPQRHFCPSQNPT
jgi:hypothetical protein